MSMAQTDMILTAIEGLGGGISEINEKINADTIDRLPGQVVTIRNQSTSATLVDVTGKGELHYVLGNYVGNQGGCYQIEIDGKTFYPRNMSNSHREGGYFSIEGVLDLEGLTTLTYSARLYLSETDATVQVDFQNIGYSSYPSIGSLTQEAFETGKEQSKTSVLYTRKPLRFEQSLKIISERSCSEGGYNYIKYTLDD